ARSQEPSGTPIDNRKLSLERALSKSHRLSDLEIEIGYPRNYAHEWSKKKIEMIPTGEVSQLQTVENWFEDLHRLVVQQHNEFKSKVYGGAEPGVRRGWVLAEQLSWRHRELVGYESTKSKTLFVSCHYEGPQLEKIESNAKSKEFSVITGKDLVD